MTTSVDLGCGNIPKNPFNADTVLGVDLQGDTANIKCKVGFEPIPLETSSVDFVTGYDFIEHVPRFVLKGDEFMNPFIEAMNEIYRILKPNGVFYARTPFYPHPEAFQDPTHVNIITTMTITYFNGEMKDGYGNEFGKMYGFNGKFNGTQTEESAWLIWHLHAVK